MFAKLSAPLSVALLASALASAASADTYPSRPITLVVTSAAGSGGARMRSAASWRKN